MKALKIISLFILAFYLISTIIISLKDETEKDVKITCFIMFVFTTIPFYYVYWV